MLVPLVALLVVGAADAGPPPPAGGAVPLPLAAFKDGFRTCSRPLPEGMKGFWEVPARQVAELDRVLLVHLVRSDLSKALALPRAAYQRQYLGFARGARKLIYVNAFPAARGGQRARTHFVRFCDGGSLFWAIEYDVKARAFGDFTMNSAGGDPIEAM